MSEATGSPVRRQAPSGVYDPQARRRAKRSGRETGCWAYIPSQELMRAGIDPAGPAPFYRTVGYQRSRNARTVIVSLYLEP